jgi:hypothetical protein
MNVVVIASIIIILTVISGALFAAIFSRFGKIVLREQEASEDEKSRYNPSVTMGHAIALDADRETQLYEARTLAAKRAARTPRGGNMRIGGLGGGSQPTAFDGIDNDPISAVKIASVHGWQMLQTGAKTSASAAVAASAAPARTVAPVKSADELVPGQDYAYIEITDDMEPAEVRKARIANAKAKSAAVKALKTAESAAAPAETATAVPSSEQATPAAATSGMPAQAAPAAGGLSEPVAGVDYEVIEISDDMDPADVRKARIANAKAKSAAMKAFKEAGGQMGQAAATPAVAPQAAPPAAAPSEDVSGEPQAAATAALADIPRPEYIEITDDMDPADMRKARIENAKAKSAYNKALKAAGIDPSTVNG